MAFFLADTADDLNPYLTKLAQFKDPSLSKVYYDYIINQRIRRLRFVSAILLSAGISFLVRSLLASEDRRRTLFTIGLFISLPFSTLISTNWIQQVLKRQRLRQMLVALAFSLCSIGFWLIADACLGEVKISIPSMCPALSSIVARPGKLHAPILFSQILLLVPTMMHFGLAVDLIYILPTSLVGAVTLIMFSVKSGSPESAYGLMSLTLQLVFVGLAERTQKQLFLRMRSQERVAYDLRQLLRSANAPIVQIDKTLTIVAWNEAVARITQWKPEDVVGTSLQPLIPAEEWERVRGALGAALDSASAEEKRDSAPVAAAEHLSAEIPMFTNSGIEPSSGVPSDRSRPSLHGGKGSGSVVTLVMSFSPIRASDGSTCALLGVGHDFTAQRKTEEARSAFLASFSHELRTPLNGILGMLQLLQPLSLPPTAAHYVATAFKSSVLLLNLINDLMDFSKLSSGHLDLSPVRFSPARAVQDVCDMLAATAATRSIRLSLAVDPLCPPAVVADCARIKQIVLNFCTNALKFSNPGGEVSLRCCMFQPSCLTPQDVVFGMHPVSRRMVAGRCAGEEGGAVSVPRARAGGAAVVPVGVPPPMVMVVSVQDRGLGIKAEDLGKLFVLFSKLRDGKSFNSGGSGLGLAVCRGLAEAMGGCVAVRSVFGLGSIFSLLVPVTTDVAPAEVGDPALWAVDGSGGTVLSNPPVPRIVYTAESPQPAQRPDSSSSAHSGEAAGVDESKSAVDSTHDTQPASEPGVPPTPPPPPPPSPPLSSSSPRGRTILVVEDDAFNMEVVATLLRQDGHLLLCATSGEEAVALFRQHRERVCLVLMDLGLPGMSGVEACCCIRELEQETIRAAAGGGNMTGCRRVPVVAFTAHTLDHVSDRCMEAGMDDYLTKPAMRHQLQAMVGKWCAVEEDASGGGCSTPIG